DSNRTKEQVIEQNEETLNHVLKELQNAKDALDEDTIIHGKLNEIINKAKDIILDNKDALKKYKKTVYALTNNINDTIIYIMKRHINTITIRRITIKLFKIHLKHIKKKIKNN